MRRKPLVLKDGLVTQLPSGDLLTDGQDNFSFVLIASGETVKVPFGQEMLHVQDLLVFGDLLVEGSTFQVPEKSGSDQGFFWTTIPVGTSVTVPVNRLMLFVSPLLVLGDLNVYGQLNEV